MAEEIREVEQTTTANDGVIRERREVNDPIARKSYHQTVAERVVWFIAGILLTLLALRFILALLGANANNGFANFIYDVTHPFVSPFFSLFSYDYTVGKSRFEAFTLVAMVIYALIAWGIAKLVTLTRR